MNKIEEVANEFMEWGVLFNTLDLIDKAIKIEGALERLDCTLQELIEGMRMAAKHQIDCDKYYIPARQLS